MESWPAEPRGVRQLARHYLADVIYGANDGIITTFALVAGVVGASLPYRTAVILGAANLLADGFSMGASSYLAIRSREAARDVLGEPGGERYPHRHAVATFLAFVVVGSIPLLALVLTAEPGRRFAAVSALTLCSLFGVGAARSWVTRTRWWTAGVEMLLVGAAAAAVAYGVGRLIGALVQA